MVIEAPVLDREHGMGLDLGVARVPPRLAAQHARVDHAIGAGLEGRGPELDDRRRARGGAQQRDDD